MSATTLNLTGRTDDTGLRAIIERLSTLLSVEPERIVVCSTPQDGDRALEWNETSVDEDRSALGLTGLDTPISTDRITLIRLGPLEAPVCALIFDSEVTAKHVGEDVPRLPDAFVAIALDALTPAARLEARADRARRDDLLTRAGARLAEAAGAGPARIEPYGLALKGDGETARYLADSLFVEGFHTGDIVRLIVPDAAAAQRLADWLGVGKGARTASVRRTTKETDIALTLDLDGEGGSASTGVHFFDHMLDQIGRHGGMRLDVVCEGDVEVDAHHTIEDVCLALGDALRQALGDKRGVARFGFETPMDETRASVWIDLSGRPYCRFDGAIPGERVGDFPVEMCEHAFRSLAETLKAAIHVKVDGENAHHMIESCFKSFGRALRMAKTIEGDALPSTKGVL